MNGTNLNSSQRLDMVQKGLSPLNEEHVKMYIENNGNIKASKQEFQNRLKTLIGEAAYSKQDVGSGRESESQYVKAYEGGDYSAIDRSNGVLDEQSARKRINEDMDILSSSQTMKTISSDRLYSLHEDNSDSVLNRNKSSVDDQKMKDAGYKHTIQYLNAFIVNLKSPSYNNRINLYDSLLKVLKNDKKLANHSNKQKQYRLGCQLAEKEMYNKIKS